MAISEDVVFAISERNKVIDTMFEDIEDILSYLVGNNVNIEEGVKKLERKYLKSIIGKNKISKFSDKLNAYVKFTLEFSNLIRNNTKALNNYGDNTKDVNISRNNYYNLGEIYFSRLNLHKNFVDFCKNLVTYLNKGFTKKIPTLYQGFYRDVGINEDSMFEALKRAKNQLKISEPGSVSRAA